MDEARKALIAQAVAPVTDWYAAHRRPLPWREEPTPYHVWLSEIMLQQTRIEAVIPYYSRFLAAAPTVEALASLPDDRLMKLWEGLGYYSRARNLKKAAVLLTDQYGGVLPRLARELGKLPGIGPYTAGAIASIAYGEPEPAVDGNVLRVLSRLLSWEEDVLLPRTRQEASDALREVYPIGPAAGLLTEGLMELGEVICLPGGAPDCGACPWMALCRARLEGRQEELPIRTGRTARRVEHLTVLLLSCGEKVALRKRPQAGLLGGMWELPHLPGSLSEEETAQALSRQGLAPLFLAPLGEAKHIFTHVEWHMTGYRVTVPEEADGFQWVTAAEVRADYAVPTAFRAYTKLL